MSRGLIQTIAKWTFRVLSVLGGLDQFDGLRTVEWTDPIDDALGGEQSATGWTRG